MVRAQPQPSTDSYVVKITPKIISESIPKAESHVCSGDERRERMVSEAIERSQGAGTRKRDVIPGLEKAWL